MENNLDSLIRDFKISDITKTENKILSYFDSILKDYTLCDINDSKISKILYDEYINTIGIVTNITSKDYLNDSLSTHHFKISEWVLHDLLNICELYIEDLYLMIDYVLRDRIGLYVQTTDRMRSNYRRENPGKVTFKENI